jgi:ribosomal protein S18 acetylase RimI-like enzyme
MTCSLRSPCPSDYELIGSWVTDARQCLHWAGPSIPFPFSGLDLPRLITSAPAVVPGETSSSYVLAADPAASSEAVGFGQLVRQDRTSFRLARLIIAPIRRGSGFGASLCRLLIEKAESVAEAELVNLFVYRDNVAAIHVYSKLGFVEAPSHPRSHVMAMRKTIGRINV